MRPLRLEMEGFLAYRQRTEVDFTDVDLFVLSGPTGSGKSSVIDGMIFALYGTIPRLDDRRSVAPVISARADRARVSFRFEVGGEVYTAVRLVERTKAGATTTEARLEHEAGGEPLAGSADEVSVAVERLLGLSYDHFTKAVVLPQGAFADFLTDTPRDRQTLLRALLDIGLFEQVMQLANIRAKVAEGRAQAAGESLAKLDVPGPELVESTRLRLQALTEAEAALPARLDQILGLEAVALESRQRQQTVSETLVRLQGISPPADLESIEEDRDAAKERLAGLEKELASLDSRCDEIEKALAGHHPLARLESWRGDLAKREDLSEHRAALDLDRLGETLAERESDRDEARRLVERLRVDHAAHTIRLGLSVGSPCPVCRSTVTELVEDDGPDPMEDAREAMTRAETRADQARDAFKEAQGSLKQLDRQIDEVEERLSDAPEAADVEAEIAVVTDLTEGLAEVRVAQTTSRNAIEESRLAMAEQDRRGAAARDEMLAVWAGVADQDPPLPGDDVVDAWRRFESWRGKRIAVRTAELSEVSTQVEQTALAAQSAAQELRQWLEGLGVQPSGSPEKDLALAIARCRADIEDFEKTIARAAELKEEMGAEEARARVASSLGNHLKANNFERWLLEEALETLVDGANELLNDLSAGAYSLVARSGGFEVIDHRNADLTRTTRGLSGGETFLVSLSLALSMADQLAELTGSSSRLESVLLDEGFGSLDQESLDVVANVLDELVGRGRTVGIVTHVRELADRIPVRFEVTKGPETAMVARVGE